MVCHIKWNSLTLDIAGMIPVIGVNSDLTNAAIAVK